MATTFRTLLNRVLQTISEDRIPSGTTELTDDYHLLIAEFANQIKEEVEDAHNWRVLRQVLPVTIPALSDNAVISGANERSRLFRVQDASSGTETPLVFDVTNPSNPAMLTELDLTALLQGATSGLVTTDSAPSYFAIDSSPGTDLTVYVYPVPTTARSLQVTMVVPQNYLDVDDLDVPVYVPMRPILMGTAWYALMERGEEQGTNAMFTEERFRVSLDDAIGVDAAEQGGYELVPV